MLCYHFGCKNFNSYKDDKRNDENPSYSLYIIKH